MALTYSSIASIKAQRQLDRATSSLQKNLEHLSTGQRINRASDDAAGLAVSATLNANSRIFTQGVRNLNDGISALNLADGVLDQATTMLQRIRELATQSANGVFSRTQRLALDREAYALSSEFNRIMAGTAFNGLHLYDNSISQIRLQGGVGTEESIAMNIGQGLSRNIGTGSFSTGTNISADNQAEQAIDIDNDGDLDLISTVTNTSVKIFKNDGSGQLSLFDTVAVGSIQDVTVGDFNGDNQADLFIITPDSSGIVLNQGGGTFGSYLGNAVFGETFKEVVAGDFNNDGHTDVLMASTLDGFAPPPWGGSTTSGDYLYVMLGDGSGSFINFDTVQGVSTSFDLAQTFEYNVADMNGDGILDVVDWDSANHVVVNFGAGNGTFSSTHSYSINGNGLGTALGDYNHDGLNDIIISTDGGGVELLLNQGNNSFSHAVISGTDGSFYTNAATADINGDGNLDVYLSGVASDDLILLGDGAGGFTRVSHARGNGALFNNILADFSGDGVIDLVGRDDNDSRLELFTQLSELSTNIQRFDLTTQDGALSALDQIEAAMNRVATERGLLGSTISRLKIAVGNLDSRRIGYDEANTRIRDADVSQESSELVRNSILQNVAQSVLAQANVQGSLTLALLRDI